MTGPAPSPSSGSDGVLSGLGEFFAEKIAAHGATPAGVDWNSGAAQQLRFTQFLRLLDYADRSEEVSIIDYGCGYGALVQRLIDAERPFTYTGYDMCTAMIEAARANITDPRCRFVSDESELRPADFTIGCGLFSMRLAVPEDLWKGHVATTIGRLANLSRRGFAFNLLTRYADAHLLRSDLFYCDPSEYFELCKREYSRNVALLHDYDAFEFTLMVRLGAAPKPLVM